MTTHVSRLFALIVLGVFLLSLATLPGHLYSVDGLAYYRSATTLAWQGSLIFDPPMVWGGIRSPVWPIGLSLVQLPVALILTPIRGLQPLFDPAVPVNLGLLYDDPVYVSMSWINGVVVALTAGFSLLLALHVGLSARIAFLAALAGTLASPLFFYGHADFAQPLSTLLLVVGTLLALRARTPDRGWEWLLLVPIGALAVLTRPLEGLLGAVCWLIVVAWSRWRSGEARNVIKVETAILVGLALGTLATGVVNQVRRGSLLDIGYTTDGSMDPLASALAYLVSPGRGMLWHFPLVLLVPLGALVLYRSRRDVELVAVLLPAILIFVPYLFWMSLGDVSYGPRFLVPTLPFLAILAALALQSGHTYAKPAFALLAFLGVAANVSLLFADQLLYWFNRGDNHVGTVGFWRQFEPGAFAAIGSLRSYHPTGVGNLLDVVWLRMGHDTAWLSVVVMLALALGGLAALWAAARLTRVCPSERRTDGPSS